MGAYVHHQFERGFLLDEERLRKLVHLIAEKLDPEKSGKRYEFKVFRGDAYSYMTNAVDDILKEDNAIGVVSHV
jgi:hypothetical protein